MKAFSDGNMLCITLDGFVNLQESPAVFIPLDCQNAKIILKDGFRALPVGDLMFLRQQLFEQRGPTHVAADVSTRG